MKTEKDFKFYNFRIIIEPEKPKGYHGFVPFLRGLHTFGNTIEEVKKNLKEAIICHIQGILKDGETIPKEEDTFELIQTFSERELLTSR
ncbi:MAG: type II toxin-antitoxin system HicB family antitoxin [Patescibacteria group bacterium]